MSDFRVVDGIRKELADQLDPSDGINLYLLVDPATSDPLATLPARTHAIPVRVRHPELSARQLPYLIKLGDLGRDEAADHSIALSLAQAARTPEMQESGRSVCGWLQSDLPIDALAVQLASCATLPIDRQLRLFRYWDPRTLDLLRELLEPHQRNALLGTVSAWWWVARDGSLRSMRNDRAGSSVPFSPTPDQVAALRHAHILNRVLDVLQDMQHGVTAPGLATRVLDSVFGGKEKWQFESERDSVMYALYGLLVHPRFDRDTRVKQVMQQAHLEKTSAMDALGVFDDEFWGSLKERLSKADPIV